MSHSKKHVWGWMKGEKIRTKNMNPSEPDLTIISFKPDPWVMWVEDESNNIFRITNDDVDDYYIYAEYEEE